MLRSLWRTRRNSDTTIHKALRRRLLERWAGPLRVERLEDRIAPSTLEYTVPPGNGTHDLKLRLAGTDLQIADTITDQVLAYHAYSDITSVAITGCDYESTTLRIDFDSGGAFKFPDGVLFQGGAGGNDTLVGPS